MPKYRTVASEDRQVARWFTDGANAIKLFIILESRRQHIIDPHQSAGNAAAGASNFQAE